VTALRRWVLIGDAESPHLLKWTRGLSSSGRVDLWVASSRGFDVGFDAVVPPARRLSLGHRSRHGGGNVDLLRHLPTLGRWLAAVDADVLHAHYLTSHGTLAWLARRLWRLRGALVASAWGSDILVTPRRSVAARVATRSVLRASLLATSDSAHMADAMRALGAREVMTFPFGLDRLPAVSGGVDREPWLFYANRSLEPLYRPARVLALFSEVAARQPSARLVVAGDGSMRHALELQAAAGVLAGRVAFVGRLAPEAQAHWYWRARWFLSLPASDSVAVSVLEAMAHGAVPVLSDLPANRELVRDGENGLIVPGPAGSTVSASAVAADAGLAPVVNRMAAFLPQADSAAAANRAWVADHGLFTPAVERFLDRVDALHAPGPRRPA
jgi:glycosyltransferase involved in cell wall biosynthesis